MAIGLVSSSQDSAQCVCHIVLTKRSDINIRQNVEGFWDIDLFQEDRQNRLPLVEGIVSEGGLQFRQRKFGLKINGRK